MRYLRVAQQDGAMYGRLDGDVIRLIEGDVFGAYRVTERTVPLASARDPCN